MRVEGPVKIANTGMISADYQVGATEILPDQRMEKGFARTGVTHLKRITGLDRYILGKIVFDHRVDRLDPNRRGNIARLQFAQHLMDKHTVGHINRDFDQKFVTAMHGIAGLECCHPLPAAILEHFAAFFGPVIEILEFFREPTFFKHLYRAAQVDRRLGQHLRHTGMAVIGGAEDFLALELMVGRILFLDGHGAHDLLGFAIDQGHLVADSEIVSQVLRDRNGHRDRPEQSVC